MEIRHALPPDGPAIGALKVRAWRHAYREFMSPGYLAALDPRQEAADWTRYLDSRPPNERLWISVAGGTVTGFCRTGLAAADERLGPTAAEVYGLYLEPSVIGTGVGRELFGYAVSDLRDRGFHPLCVYAYRANPTAIRFYRRAGFVPDGAVRHDDAEIDLVESRLTG